MSASNPKIVTVAKSASHAFSKELHSEIKVLAGLGVEGDAHNGVTVKHRSRVAIDPTQPNLRQLHLIHGELLGELRAKGFDIQPGDMGENITTNGINLLGLLLGSLLHIGDDAVIEVTGLRNPCAQLDNFQQGLMKAVLDRDEQGDLVRKAGIMGTIKTSGSIKPGDQITVELPPEPHIKLRRV